MTVPTNLDMDVLRSFVAGVDLGGFARAAGRLGRSPAAVSAQLRKLEVQTGQVLFRKSGRQLGLTESGEALLAYARRLLALNDEAMAAVRGVELDGWVRLGLPQDFAETWLPAVLGRFARANPKVRIEVRVGRGRDLQDDVAAGRLDLALAWGEGPETLATWPMVWIGAAAEQRRNAPGEPVPLILFEPPCGFRAAGIAALESAGLPWRVVFTSPSLAGLWAAAAAGLGVTLRTPLGLPDGLTILELEATGLPPLPVARLVLHTGPMTLAPAPERLADILRETVSVGPLPSSLVGMARLR